MDIVDVYEWIVRGVLAVNLFMAALVVIMLLLDAINEVTYQIRRLRRRRRRRATTTSVVEKLLESIPDVAYQELPGGDSDRESCVICVTPYEAGEACSVLPACKHLFHKACVAKWLRVKCTCPLCRAAVALPHPVRTAGQP
ncbi:RING-H2 finger protein ATL56-like [Miscanthus floridulus]|uniref:RING-H2 finger protein ATL56-like n=1 Tax=Miscanthus floridulus TaxID=154761 RepID=UPI0034585975